MVTFIDFKLVKICRLFLKKNFFSQKNAFKVNQDAFLKGSGSLAYV
jgi:hypothetical protein